MSHSHVPGNSWHWLRLWWAPHRLAFAAAALMLMVSSLWWLAQLGMRAGGLAAPPPTVSPTLLHGVAMTYGFLPLFFCGFLFTAGPKWLGVEAPRATQLTLPVGLQALGTLLWLAGGWLDRPLSLAGGTLLALGLLLAYGRFAGLWLRSPAVDRVHASLIALAGTWGVACLLGVLWAETTQQPDLASRWLLSGLWGFVVGTYVTVAHRMIPFFTSSALPLVRIWRPMWVLAFLWLAVLTQVLAAWWSTPGGVPMAWGWLHGFWMLVSGLVVLWLAFVWGLVQSLRIRLLLMLHIGFVWLGLGFILEAIGLHWALLIGPASWALGALHATTMGFLGSLMLAMVTRVSCGHGGRALVADGWVWGAFWLLQLATGLRVWAALADAEQTQWLTLLALCAWTAAVLPWALRLLRWYGQPRADGRPG